MSKFQSFSLQVSQAICNRQTDKQTTLSLLRMHAEGNEAVVFGGVNLMVRISIYDSMCLINLFSLPRLFNVSFS